MWRALRGEFYLLTHRRAVRWAILLVALVPLLQIFTSLLILRAEAAADGKPFADLAGWNFWPRLAHGSRAGMYFVELLVIGLVAGGLPREISLGVVRDPLTRGIARSSLILARLLSSLFLALLLYGVVVVVAWGMSALLFDPGAIMDDGFIMLEEAEISGPVTQALLHAIPSLLALAGLATLLGVLFRRGVLAAGCGIGLILLVGAVHEALGSAAPWLFLDTLAGLGPDSFLEQAAGFAEGYSNFYAESFDTVVAAGWVAPLPALALTIVGAWWAFRRRPV